MQYEYSIKIHAETVAEAARLSKLVSQAILDGSSTRRGSSPSSTYVMSRSEVKDYPPLPPIRDEDEDFVQSLIGDKQFAIRVRQLTNQVKASAEALHEAADAEVVPGQLDLLSKLLESLSELREQTKKIAETKTLGRDENFTAQPQPAEPAEPVKSRVTSSIPRKKHPSPAKKSTKFNPDSSKSFDL